MQSKMIMRSVGVLFLVAALIFGTMGPALAADAEKNLRMGTAAVGSLLYVFGAAVADVVGRHTDLKIEVLPQGDVMALPLMATHEVDLIMVANDALDCAYMGTGIYERQTKGKGHDVRLLMLGMRNAASTVVTGNSGIRNYEDLKGKRVVLNYGTQQALNMGSRASLIAGGITEKDVKVLTAADIPSAVNLVMEGKADACFGGIGVPAFQELAAARGGILYLEAKGYWDEVAKISKAFFPMVVKKGPLGIPKDTTLVGRNFDLISRPDLSDDTVYLIVKTLWEYDSELAPHHPRLKDWVKDRFVGVQATAPYHPGAIKFYKEVGAWNSEMETRNDELLKKQQ